MLKVNVPPAGTLPAEADLVIVTSAACCWGAARVALNNVSPNGRMISSAARGNSVRSARVQRTGRPGPGPS